jgi:hypothetical protein
MRNPSVMRRDSGEGLPRWNGCVSDAEGEEGQSLQGELTFGVRKPFVPHGLGDIDPSRSRWCVCTADIDLGDHPVIQVTTLRGQCNSPLLDLAEANAQRSGAHLAVGMTEGALLRQRLKRRLAKKDIRPPPSGRSLDLLDHRDTPRLHPRVEIVDVENARRQVVNVR